MSAFSKILEKFRAYSFSERDKGFRFERLMQSYLQTDPMYVALFQHVYLWNEFPFKNDFGGKDIGIDLVAQTFANEFWAIQCKCYQADTTITKADVDTFLSTSSRTFLDENGITRAFSHRLWIDTTNGGFNTTASETIQNQIIPVSRIGLSTLEEAPVEWEKLEQGIFGTQAETKKKTPREHQIKAIEAAHNYYMNHDRGKLIMACGTGKTYTSLKIAENETGNNGLVLFLVPSIALLAQILREWTANATEKINAICICSDAEVSKVKNKTDDYDGFTIEDLALPASTDVSNITKQLRQIQLEKRGGMTVVFSTYQSIDVISKAQKELGETAFFDMIICDEAHRTTGVTLSGSDESAFVKVHDDDFLKARKRMYMTATPRIYKENVQAKARENDAVLCSMDDTSIYGDEFFHIGFGEAVEKQLLSDYKVLILTINPEQIAAEVQTSVANDKKEIFTDDQAKLIGCINALSKLTVFDDKQLKKTDPEPMRRAVAFSQTIRSSKEISELFNACKESYFNKLPNEKQENLVNVTAKHVDGTMDAIKRQNLLSWLKSDDTEKNECRILNNVRCLSEGVDVPSLDAVLFLAARNSEIDVVQSVGRVMRTAPDKKYGYIIIPIIVPSDVKPEDALDDNDRFKVVWKILNALRAHDDRFEAVIDKLSVNKREKGASMTNGRIGVSDGLAHFDGDEFTDETHKQMEVQMQMRFETLQDTIYARMVQKVGNRRYWEQWAQDVAKIAEKHIAQINKLIAKDGRHKEEFEMFLKGLRKNINPSITPTAAVEMLAQHLITKPVFEALFENYSFVSNNPVSKAMQRMIDLLNEQSDPQDAQSLERFYKSVKTRAEGINNAEGKQKIIIELYDKFFKTALPKVVEQLGIVYTPVEVVDFIIHSVSDVLQKEFGRSLSDENVNIIDPFTGTGTFITRLLQSGLIRKEDLKRKYKNEIKANEIMLLAYYIASINIENVYHDLMENDSEYHSFLGICLTDTFQLGEDDSDIFSEMFPQNSMRASEQKKTPIHIVIGNPPYSVGQKSANDNAQNIIYPKLDNNVYQTYAKDCNASSVKALHDSYIKAFRWATDRLDKTKGGIIGFITNGNWIDGNGMNGFRRCLENDFSEVYILNLRGAIRGKQGNTAKMEGQNVFNIMTGVAITILVKKPDIKGKKANIYYHDIGNYLTRTEKLNLLSKHRSIMNMPFKTIYSNEFGDWINKRSDLFYSWISIEADKKLNVSSQSYFVVHSLGVNTNRDAWSYNFSISKVKDNMRRTIDVYNNQVNLLKKEIKSNPKTKAEQIITFDDKLISWSSSLMSYLERGIIADFQYNMIKHAAYRPFVKENLYYGERFVHRRGQFDIFFPTQYHKNLIICCSGVGSSKDFSTIITDCIPDLQLMFNGQCFPLYYYEENKNVQCSLFDEIGSDRYTRREAVSDFILKQARSIYGGKVTKEDIFYYVYGFLHSPEYRQKFSADLKKMLPRIPLVEKPTDFWAFSKAGRELAELHLNYETIDIECDNLKITDTYKKFDLSLQDYAMVAEEQAYYRTGSDFKHYRVEKMRFGKLDSKTKDRSTIIYNDFIRIENIPEKAYEYVVNGKSAIEWIMDRYAVSTDSASGITNDPNDWAVEHHDEKYIFNLLLRIITLSEKTVDIVKRLPNCL